MPGVDVVRRGPERLRVAPWRGDGRVALVAPLGPAPPPTAAMVRHCCDVLARRGYVEAVTGALAASEQPGFVDAGFTVREELHLLAHDLADVPPAPAVKLRRATRFDRSAALRVDHAAFPPFWQLDEAGLSDALTATPAVRFRVTAGGEVLGYAVTGRAGARGYVQRLAVHHRAQGRGIGRALVIDALQWLRRRGVANAVVNTQVGNDRALALYQDLGFRLQPSGLAVLVRRLGDRQPTS